MIHTRFKDMREDKDWTQEYMAGLLFIARSTYSAYENGANAPPLEILIRISEIYSVSVDYLLDLTDDKTKPEPKQTK